MERKSDNKFPARIRRAVQYPDAAEYHHDQPTRLGNDLPR